MRETSKGVSFRQVFWPVTKRLPEGKINTFLSMKRFMKHSKPMAQTLRRFAARGLSLGGWVFSI